MNDFYIAFRKYLLPEAERINKKYPAFWSSKIIDTALFNNMQRLFPGDHYDITALVGYYRSEARSKDATRVFLTATKELVSEHGYGPDQCHAMAIWYFILVSLHEYDQTKGIDQFTDLHGLLNCYLNIGEIDYEHDWNE